jgi:hypothetical protein
MAGRDLRLLLKVGAVEHGASGSLDGCRPTALMKIAGLLGNLGHFSWMSKWRRGTSPNGKHQK